MKKSAPGAIGRQIRFITLSLAAMITGSANSIHAETYRTTLGPQDRINSQGQAIHTIQGILQQDRANVHALGHPDSGDQVDGLFSDKSRRQQFNNAQVRIAPNLNASILSGRNVTVIVDCGPARAGILEISVTEANGGVRPEQAEQDKARAFQYVTTLGPNDFRNRSGKVLTSIGDVLAQDRANVNSFGRPDAADQADLVFVDPEKRLFFQKARIESPDIVMERVRGQLPVLVTVSVFDSGRVVVALGGDVTAKPTANPGNQVNDLDELDRRVAQLMSEGKWNEALAPAIEQVAKGRQARGNQYENTAIAEMTLALVYGKLGKVDQALAAAREAAATMERSEKIRPASPNGALPYIVCGNLLLEHTPLPEIDSLNEALVLLRRAWSLKTKYDKSISDTANIRENVGKCLLRLGRYHEAEEIFSKAVTDLSNTSEKNDFLNTVFLTGLGEAQKGLRNAKGATSSFRSALKALDGCRGQNPAASMVSLRLRVAGGLIGCDDLNNAAQLLEETWRDARRDAGAGTDTSAQVALLMLEKISPYSHPRINESAGLALDDFVASGKPDGHWRLLKEICVYGKNSGDYDLSKRAAIELLELVEKAPANDGKDQKLGEAVANLAIVEAAFNHDDRARQHYEDALNRIRKANKKPTVTEALIVERYGTYLYERGEYSESEWQFRVALAIADQVTVNPITIQNALGSLGLIREMLSDYEEAIAIYRRAVAHAKEHLPGDSGHTTAINNLALALLANRQGAEAEELWKELIRLRRSTSVPDNTKMAVELSNMGLLKLTFEKKPADAAALFREALELSGADDEVLVKPRLYFAMNLASALEDMGDIKTADGLFERCVESLKNQRETEFKNIPTALARLGRTRLKLNRREDALRCAKDSLNATMALTEEVFTFTSERERLRYEPHIHYDLLVDLADDGLLAETMLRTKGIVLDSVLSDTKVIRATKATPDNGDPLVLSKSLRREHDRLTILVEPGSPKPPRLVKIESTLQKIDSDLARMTSATRKALHLNVAEVSAQVPADAILMDYLRAENCYGVCVWSPGLPPRWVKLGSIEEIDRKISNTRRILSESAVADNGELLRSSLRELFDILVRPAMFDSFACKRLLISPDGLLHQVPFSMLLDEEGHAIIEKLDIALVSSARDLLKPETRISDTNIQIFCDPAFDSKLPLQPSDKRVAIADGPAQFNSRVEKKLDRLPGTAEEGRAIQTIVSEHGWKTTMFSQGAATESAWYAAKTCSVLHFATHGIILDSPSGSSLTGEMLDHSRSARPCPLELGMLALTGAQCTMNAWLAGESPPTANDGLLLATEISDQNLADTNLVVLSACDTGLGNIRSGEGVVGLKRAFISAGAQNVIATLWAIPDEETSVFMQAFYRNLVSSRDPRRSLNETQRTLFKQWHTEKGLCKAVTCAGAFTLDVQGVQSAKAAGK